MKKANLIASIVGVAVLAVFAPGCNMNKSSSSASTSGSNDNKATNSSSSSSSPSTTSSSTSAAPAPDIAGKYNINGTNPDGAPYKGTLEVISRGDVYQFRWNAGSVRRRWGPERQHRRGRVCDGNRRQRLWRC